MNTWLADGHVGCFHLLAVVNRATLTPPGSRNQPRKLTSNSVITGSVNPFIYILRSICESISGREPVGLDFQKHFLYLSEVGAGPRPEPPVPSSVPLML